MLSFRFIIIGQKTNNNPVLEHICDERIWVGRRKNFPRDQEKHIKWNK